MQRSAILGPIAAAVILLAGLAAYANSFNGPFAFDDVHSILQNPSIHRLWPVWDALRPPNDGATVQGRPLVNLSLAVNYAIGGLNVRGYHVFNLTVHLLAGLALFGLVRVTLERSRGGFGPSVLRPLDPVAFGFAVALLWTVHPLQTESVTFVSDRAESLMGLFYLLTLYCFAQGATGHALASQPSPSEGRVRVPRVLWLTFSVFFCLLGMATKEVMVSAPLIVLLYDRTFASGTFKGAWKRRRAYYLCLAATWLLLGALVAGMGGNRGHAAGFGSPAPWWMYSLTQCRAVPHYLHLALWPRPLVFDYGKDLVAGFSEVAPQAIFLAVLAFGTAFALRRLPVLGFLGAWFFVILAPSSSFVPLASQTMAEHRMYLPLAAVVALAVYGLSRTLGLVLPAGEGGQGSQGAAEPGGQRPKTIPFLIVVSAAAVGFGFLTSRRNEVFATQVNLWTDTVLHSPDNARAHYNLGFALDDAGSHAQARDQYTEALRLDPIYPEAHYMLANDLANEGRFPEAIAHYEEALRLNPEMGVAHFNLSIVLAKSGRTEEALSHLRETLRLNPDDPDVHRDMGYLLRMMGREEEARAEFDESQRLARAFPRPSP
jgi:hypothetical protein